MSKTDSTQATASSYDSFAATLDALWDFSNPAASEAKFREILNDANGALRSTRQLQLLTQIARTQSLRSNFDEAHEILDNVAAEFDQAAPVVQVRYLLERGRTFNSAKSVDEAHPLFERAWEIARAAKLDGLAVDAAHMLGIVTRGDEAVAWNERAMAYAEASADPHAKRWLGALYNNLGWTHHDSGDYERALDHFERGLRWREARDDEEATRIAKWSVGRALRSLERHREALALQEELAGERAAIASPDGFVFEELGELHLALGETEAAAGFFAEALPLLEEFDWLDRARVERIRALAAC